MTRPKPVDLTKIKKILVCMFKFHGDVLLISSFLKALKNHIGHAQIDCLVFSETGAMIEGHPSINKLILYKKKSLFKRFTYDLKRGFRIRRGGYDLAFNMSQGDRGAFFCFMSRARVRVGFDSLGKGFFKKNSIFTHLVAKTSLLRHIVDINLDPLRIIGINPINAEDRQLFLSIEKKELHFVDSVLQEHDLEKNKFIILHTISRYEHKHWPSKKWAELISILQKKNVKIVLSGGPTLEQKSVIREILGHLESQKGVYNFCGLTSLKGLAALIDYCRLLVTIDSVPLHMSSALKKPVVALFGPSIEQKWGPYQNPNARIVAMNLACRSCDLEGCGNSWISDCMQNLPVDQVNRAVSDLLECKAFS